MENKFSSEQLLERLKGLSKFQQLLFGLSCAERLYNNYVLFCEREKWGDPTALRKGLDYCWAWLRGEPSIREELTGAIIVLEKNTPDGDAFPSVLAAFAQDAAVAVLSLLSFLVSPSSELIVEVATLSCNSVDLFVQESEGMEDRGDILEDRILKHEAMQRELTEQKSDIELLRSVSWSEDFLRNFEGLRRAPAKSNLGF